MSPILPRLSIAATFALLSLGAVSKPVDMSGPVRIEAQSARHDTQSQETVFRGSVIARRGDLSIQADVVRVSVESGGTEGELQGAIIRATGSPVVLTLKRTGKDSEGTTEGDFEARAARASYDVRTGVVVFEGSCTIEDGRNRVEGERLEYDLKSGRFKAEGREDSRILAVIQP